MAKKRKTNQTPKKRRRSADDWGPRFIKALSQSGIIGDAAKMAKVGRATVYVRRDADAEFRKAMRLALRESDDLLEKEAQRRAASGTLKPVFQGGRRVGVIREYSDTLLIFLLKARRPKRFRDNVKIQHQGDPKNPVNVAHSGSVTHEHQHDHVISPDALREFAADVAAAGLGDVQANGEG